MTKYEGIIMKKYKCEENMKDMKKYEGNMKKYEDIL